MKICGLQKTTLLDFPGHVAATIFLGGCNFRCPFCHNSGLLGNDAEEAMTEASLFTFLKRRTSVLEGVCITGGEPTLSDDLEDFIRRIRQMGYLIKLDTNGYKPAVLKDLAGKGLLDYIAMDIKAGRENYPRVAGIPGIQMEKIEESAAFLINGSIPYEFRTTVCAPLHTPEEMAGIGRWLKGAKRYFLQPFVDSGELVGSGMKPLTKEEIEALRDSVLPDIPSTQIRGQ